MFKLYDQVCCCGSELDGSHDHNSCGPPISKGYHLGQIPKGEYGEISKIKEEVAELEDAHIQGCRIMELIELSDIIAAIDGYLKKNYRDMELADLIGMAQVTNRAFESGERQ